MTSIQVIATTYDGTRAAIETAALLARASGAPLSVLVPRIAAPLNTAVEADDDTTAAAEDYRLFVEQLGAEGHVRICHCAAIDDLIAQLTSPGMMLVVGGPSGRWFMSPEERFANRLSRLGRRVLFASTGPSPTSRRTAVMAPITG